MLPSREAAETCPTSEEQDIGITKAPCRRHHVCPSWAIPAGRSRLGDPGWAITAADFDGDGHQDLILANNAVVSGWQNRLYRGNGSGLFVEATFGRLPADTSDCRGVLLRDLDNDEHQFPHGNTG